MQINNTTTRRFVAICIFVLAFVSWHTILAQTPTTVYTCKYTPVLAFIRPELSEAEKAWILNQVAQQHPNVQVLSGPTNYYNCHSYAYHLTEGWSNQVWIDHYDNSYITNSNIQKYWNDCYQVTSNPAAAVKIYYTGDHSAVSSGSGKYDSKWGAWPLMRHDPHDVPASYHPYSRLYYERQPPPLSVAIDGPDFLYTGETGNYTASVSSNNGAINTYSWQIQEQYTNGQSSGWLPFMNGGNSPYRSLYMPSNFIRAVLKITVSDNTASATSTKFIYNPSGGGALRVAASGLQAAPNPFSSSTVLSYTLAKDASVLLEVFSSDRRRMVVLANGKAKAGAQEYRVDAASWASGTYIAELTITDETNTPRKESVTLILAR